MRTFIFVCFWLMLAATVGAPRAGAQTAPPDTARARPAPPASTDVRDLAHRLLLRLAGATARDSARPTRPRMFLIVPVAGYSQQTGTLGEIAATLAFQQRGANLSSLAAVLMYTQQRQTVFTATTSLWLPDNAWNLAADWRLMHYPQSTYGLGMFTSTTSGVVSMDYDYLRLYQTAYRRVAPGWYAGLGLHLDSHWNIVSRNGRREVTRISRYTIGVEGRSLSVGPVLAVQHDTRANVLNPTAGSAYLNVQFRPNMRALGSLTDFQTLQADGRAYLRLRRGSPNVLALWSYNVFTLSGNPPFLDMPATGWDMYSNTGRGFIQGRFRGKSLVYAEAEYRFRITRNQLLGGVVFSNAQSVTELTVVRNEVMDQGFRRVVPAVGAGLRIQLNKATRTNLCVDYGVGLDGSHGLSLNLGEMF